MPGDGAAKIYAQVAGFAATQDAHSLTRPDPTGRSYAMAIHRALAEANTPPAEVGCVVPHGLGIPAFDRAELAGLQRAFGADLPRIPMALVKAQIGNCGSGCGVDVAAAVLSLYHGLVPPSINTALGTVNVNARRRELPMTVALTTAYGQGGQNAALLLRKIEDSKSPKP